MAKTGAIHLGFPSEIGYDYIKILHILITHHWSMDKYGEVSFMVNGTFDWQSASLDELSKIKLEVENSVYGDFETCVDLIWEDNYTIIGLLYLNAHTLLITISENIIKLNDNSNVDFQFYLEALSPIKNEISSAEINYVYD